MTINVLIVEDDPAIRRLTSAVLKRYDMKTEIAVDGLDAIEKLESSAYDVIVLDLMMPRMTGTQLLDYLRQNDPAHIPRTVVVSADTDKSMVKAMTYGIYDFMRKPYNIDDLAALVMKCASENNAMSKVM